MDTFATQLSLLARVRDPADQAAWVRFDARYRELILRFCRVRGLQLSDAEDVRQNVMMKLTAALRNFEYQPQRGRFRGYLGTVVRNAIATLKARPGHAECVLDSAILASAETEDDGEQEQRWEREWADHHYRLAMRRLRDVVEPRSISMFERMLSGATPENVAREHGVNVEAVWKVRQRMRTRLQALIAEQIREEDEPYGAAEFAPRTAEHQLQVA